MSRGAAPYRIIAGCLGTDSFPPCQLVFRGGNVSSVDVMRVKMDGNGQLGWCQGMDLQHTPVEWLL